MQFSKLGLPFNLRVMFIRVPYCFEDRKGELNLENYSSRGLNEQGEWGFLGVSPKEPKGPIRVLEHRGLC